eukprot:s5225_g1.t1
MSAVSDGSGGTSTGVSHQLATLVPSFDPAKGDDLQIYQQKVELVLSAWPKDKIHELVTRLILNCSGSAFQKLQLHHGELLENDVKSVKKVIELLGGHWGKIGLERQYEDAEQALFHTAQLPDESNDSFIARADVMWSKLLARKLTIADLQAFILLRGSNLSPEEKKKVILESDQSLEGKLTVQRVAEAIRLLGASFFMEMTGQKKNPKTKVYSSDTLVTEEDDGDPTLHTAEEYNEEDFEEAMLLEGDPDAALIADFEQAASDLIQEDPDLSAAYTSYQDARRRLAEKFRNRGFWPTSRAGGSNTAPTKGKGFGKGGGKGRGSFGGMKPKRSLQDRILNSFCRQCGRKGHWRAECPYRQSNPSQSGGNSAPTATTGSMPTSTLTVDQEDAALPLEFLMIPEVSESTLDVPVPSFMPICVSQGFHKSHYQGMIHGESVYDSGNRGGQLSAMQRLQSWGFRNERPPETRLTELVKARVHSRKPVDPTTCQKSHADPDTASDRQDSVACFATHGSFGILDLGASKTVIGSDSLPELIQSLDESTRQGLQRTACHITFRFGNQATLTSKQALILPLGSLKHPVFNQ